LAFQFNLLDTPNYRKLHHGSVPLIGGLIIYSSMLFFYFSFDLTGWLKIIFLSSFIIVFFGFLDDKFQISVTIRILGQFIASFFVIFSGLYIVDIGNYINSNNIELGYFGFIFTLLTIIGLTNAINFIDGIDGLCSSISLVSLISILLYSNLNGNPLIYQFILLLIICLIIFLLSNLRVFLPQIFLGDSGSMLLGFTIGWLLIYCTHPDVNLFHPVLTLWCVSLPTLDLLSVFTRRVLKKINPFQPDRRHIHHILISKGCSNNKTLLILVLISILNSLIGYYSYYLFGPLVSLILFIILFITYLGSTIYIGRINHDL
tara:strand:- start:278 stop:1228 length:951 start_codon:yes stop_codon:yes gene_type:complete